MRFSNFFKEQDPYSNVKFRTNHNKDKSTKHHQRDAESSPLSTKTIIIMSILSIVCVAVVFVLATVNSETSRTHRQQNQQLQTRKNTILEGSAYSDSPATDWTLEKADLTIHRHQKSKHDFQASYLNESQYDAQSLVSVGKVHPQDQIQISLPYAEDFLIKVSYSSWIQPDATDGTGGKINIKIYEDRGRTCKYVIPLSAKAKVYLGSATLKPVTGEDRAILSFETSNRAKIVDTAVQEKYHFTQRNRVTGYKIAAIPGDESDLLYDYFYNPAPGPYKCAETELILYLADSDYRILADSQGDYELLPGTEYELKLHPASSMYEETEGGRICHLKNVVLDYAKQINANVTETLSLKSQNLAGETFETQLDFYSSYDIELQLIPQEDDQVIKLDTSYSDEVIYSFRFRVVDRHRDDFHDTDYRLKSSYHQHTIEYTVQTH